LRPSRLLSRKEGIPLAIVGGLAAIHHGYERFTQGHQRGGPQRAIWTSLPGSLPQYGIKVIWNDRKGGIKLQCEGVPIDVVPEGREALETTRRCRFQAPRSLEFAKGAGYAGIAGWMETKLGSYRVQDRADVVQVIKVTTAASAENPASTWKKRTQT